MLRWVGAAGVSFMAGACGGGSAASSAVASPNSVASPQSGGEASVSPQSTKPDGSATFTTQFGVNYYDLFHRFITYAGPFEPESQLKQLSDRGLKIVRFAACPIWARDWTLWKADPEHYMAGLERIFVAADKLGMKLVPVLMSAPFGLSDFMGEPFSAWGNASSATRRAFDDFVPLMVQRYHSHSSLFMWEFSNEMNAFANNPSGYKYYPPVDSVIGKARTELDNYTGTDVQNIYARFAELVRIYDTRHPLSSGSTTPNGAQIRREKGLSGLDSRDDLMAAMEQTLAGGTEILSVHVYDDISKDRFDAKGSSFAEILAMARAVADRKGVKLYLGEFGLARSGDDAVDKARFHQMISEIRAAKVDYASVWCYDWLQTPAWNITPNNERAWMLDELIVGNS
jgi:sugar phosphate isomerase/epimerase